MVGIGESLVDDVPCLLPRKLLLVNEDSEQLDAGDCWVGIVELNLVFLGEGVPVLMLLLKSPDDVSDGGGAEEVLLLESELLA